MSVFGRYLLTWNVWSLNSRGLLTALPFSTCAWSHLNKEGACKLLLSKISLCFNSFQPKIGRKTCYFSAELEARLPRHISAMWQGVIRGKDVEIASSPSTPENVPHGIHPGICFQVTPLQMQRQDEGLGQSRVTWWRRLIFCFFSLVLWSPKLPPPLQSCVPQPLRNLGPRWGALPFSLAPPVWKALLPTDTSLNTLL